MPKKKATALSKRVKVFDELVYVNPKTLKPDERNPRAITDQELEEVTRSIDEFTFIEPMIVRKSDKLIIAGHQRLKASQLLKLKTVPVRFIECSDTDAKILNIAFNKLGGSFDNEVLLERLDEIEVEDGEVSLTGFDEAEIALLTDDNENISSDSSGDAVPPVPEKPRTKLGDIWILGKHRLLCGDSTDQSCVSALMRNARARLCLTDPPYSVNYGTRKKSQNVNASIASYVDPKDAEQLLSGFMALLPCDALVMTYADKHLHEYVCACDKLKIETVDLLVWKKQHFCLQPGARYQKQHEHVFIARRKGKKLYSRTPGNASTVFEINRETSNDDHPTTRPLELWLKLTKYHSKRGEILYDPFCGSGTTIVAAEKLDRIAYCIELSPYFVDVAVERWQNFTGKKAKRAKRAKSK